jgi:hypothetical protein
LGPFQGREFCRIRAGMKKNTGNHDKTVKHGITTFEKYPRLNISQ